MSINPGEISSIIRKQIEQLIRLGNAGQELWFEGT